MRRERERERVMAEGRVQGTRRREEIHGERRNSCSLLKCCSV